jgi:hypothetical protein
VEIYILDNLLRRISVFDKFESLIWTERFQDIGDFELDLKSTLENRSQFLPGTKLAINESYRVMTVEAVEDTTDDDGKQMLKVAGTSLENMLADRIAKENPTDLEVEPTWDITDTPGSIARTMFKRICEDGSFNTADKIPFLMPQAVLGPLSHGTIPEESSEIKWSQAPDGLLTVIKNVLSPYDLGFRLYRNFDTSQLYFDVYSGDDRTTRQTTFPPVVFATNLETLQNTTELTTIQNSKNVAYVLAQGQTPQIVLDENVDPDIEGFERRVLAVTVDLADDDPDPTGTMIQAGQQALRENRGQALFDGEVNQYSQFKYGIDYQLGDIVEMRNVDGIISYKRVTEQIFVSDNQGERSYPTLAEDFFAGVDTWIAWNTKTTVWEDFDSEMTAWADM